MARRFRSPSCVSILCIAAFLAQGPRASASPVQTPDDRAACRALRTFTVAAGEIGLPTHGAHMRSAKYASTSSGGFCRIVGEIVSVDPAAQGIRFEVNLPAAARWNGKAVHFGGGAFDGWLKIADGQGPGTMAKPGAPTPLERGYATFGDDGGHHQRHFYLPDALEAVSAKFARNLEQRLNFDGDHLKKTHDVAMLLIQARYGRRPVKLFFLGGSVGGREALRVAQRYPESYDGVLAAYAAWDQIELDLQFIRVSQAMYGGSHGLHADSAWVPKKKLKMLAASVDTACDAQDGVRDGIISDPAGCHYDPTALRCPDGDSHHGCLSSRQLHTVEVMASEQRTAEPVTHGVQSIPGFNAFSGADMTGQVGLLDFPLRNPIVLLNSFYYLVGDGVLRYFLTGDAHFNALTFDVRTGGSFHDGLLRQSEQTDSSDPDLTRFAAHGGKLLLVHGTADDTIPTLSSVDYYRNVVQTMGQAQADLFLRLYLVPGYGHGHGVFNAGFDALQLLEDWTSNAPTEAQHIGPHNFIVYDRNQGPGGRTRPLCAWPSWPRFTGGDVNRADSFTCQQPQIASPENKVSEAGNPETRNPQTPPQP